MNRIFIGKLGESYAENFLQTQGYEVIAKNFYSRFGEIDLIALDFNGQFPQLVFVEVKTRTSDHFGEPQESISHKKITKIIKTALHFLNSSTKNLPRHWRIDGIAVKLNSDQQVKSLKHFKNILDGY